MDEQVERAVDVIADALADADMEVAYVSFPENAAPVYAEAGADAREPLKHAVRAVLRSLPGSEARAVARVLREFARSPKLPPSTVFIELADRLDRAPTREGPTRDEIADTAQDAAADCGKPLDPDVADVIAARVLALSPTEPCATCGGTRVIAQDSHSPCVECDPPARIVPTTRERKPMLTSRDDAPPANAPINKRCPTCGRDGLAPTTAAAQVRAKWRVGEFEPNANLINQVVDIAEKMEARLREVDPEWIKANTCA
jgi:hypothetical protein